MIIDPDAEADIASARRYFESQRVGRGDDFETEVERALAEINRNPAMIAEVEDGVRCWQMTRSSYLIFYRIVDQEVVVFAVISSARDESVWRSRL